MPPQIVKEAAQTEWLINQRWRDSLHEKAAHMSLGIPHGTPHIQSGMGWKEIAIMAAGLTSMASVASMAGLAGLLIWLNATKAEPPPPPAAGDQTSTERTETITRQENLDLIFHDGQGNRIVVPRKAEAVE